MKMKLLAAAAATVLAATGASAETVYNTSLPNVNGPVGTNVATTTTTPTGTRTTVTGVGPARASATPVLNSWFQANIGAGSTVGITTDFPDQNGGNGSAYFNSTQGGSGKADLIYNFGTNGALTPVALSSLTSVSFDFYRDLTSVTDPNLAPVLRFDMRKNGAFAGSLVFENVYQAQQPAPVGTWTTLTANLNSGIWWATNAALGPTFANANGGQKTLAQWIADNAGADLTVYAVELGIGSGWSGTFFGAADNVQVSFGDLRTVSADFEVQADAAVPEPATWAMMIAGFGLVGGAMRRRTATVRFA